MCNQTTNEGGSNRDSFGDQVGIEFRSPTCGTSGLSDIQLLATGTAQRAPGYLFVSPDSYFADDSNRNFSSDSEDYISAASQKVFGKSASDSKWDWTDFAIRYLNPWSDSSAVTLTEIGLARDFENSSSVRQAVDEFIDKILVQAGTPGEPATLLVRETTVTDVTHESSSLFSIGHSPLFMEGLCTSENCYFNFSIRDSFSKPLWWDSREIGLNFDFGNVYGIDHDFRQPIPYQNAVPRLPR